MKNWKWLLGGLVLFWQGAQAHDPPVVHISIRLDSMSARPELVFHGDSNRTYHVQFAESLHGMPWGTVSSNMAGSGVELSVVDSQSGPWGFYRVLLDTPILTAVPPSLYFGAVQVAQTSTPSILYLTNEDTNSHTLMMLELLGDQPTEFQLSGTPPPSTVMEAGQTIQFNVAFAPTGTGVRNASLKCHFDNHGHHLYVPLSGVGEYTYRINAGGGAYTDSQSRVWSPDAGFFSAGNPYSTTSIIAGTDMQALYQSERWDDAEIPEMLFSFPVAPGGYVVRLHFAEIFEGNSTVGARLFDVKLNGQAVLTNYDIVADVGFLNATVKEFFVEATNSVLTVEFIHQVDNPKVSAIEVLSGKLQLDSQYQEWGHVLLGEAGVESQVILRNTGSEALTMDELVFRIVRGAAHDFSVEIDGVVYSGEDWDVTIPVSIVIGAGESKTLILRYTPTEEIENDVWLDLRGNFPQKSIHLLGTGGSGGGHPFLHTVIHALPLVVDYDANGSEAVQLDGRDSHTHQFGHVLSRFEWSTNGVVFSTNVLTVHDFGLGTHEVQLMIYDDNEPPETLAASSFIQVVNPSNVPGSLALYYEASPGEGEGSAAAYVQNLPAKAHFGERLAGLGVTGAAGRISSTPYSGATMARLQAQIQVDAMGTYGFAVQGGSTSRLFVGGAEYGGPQMLMAGRHALEARFAVPVFSNLPLEVLWSFNGGAWSSIPPSRITHDERTLAPVINTAPSEGLDLGGNSVEITGLGFFPASQVVVHWGASDLVVPAVTVTPERITFVSPPSNGLITVTVETPQGISDSFDYHYTASGPVPVAFNVTNVAMLAAPTQGAWGPDGRFYVASVMGTITAFSFDDEYNVTNTQVISTLEALPNKNILGITFNPREAAGPPRVYVAHSFLYANGGGCFSGTSEYSGAISALTGPAFDTLETLIDGLPVSNHDHGVNGLQFDQEGNLYIAIGGNSNAGITNCNMGGLPESPLAAAILKAELSKPGFNGHVRYIETATGVTNMDQVFGDRVDVAPGVDVRVYASGLRNPYDLLLTTDGLLFSTDNGPNAGFGGASLSPTTAGPDPEQGDTLNLIVEGNYYGHPNRNRGRYDARQNVYYDNAQPSIPGVFSQGLATFSPSVNGIDEYRAQTFNGAMRGELLLQKWNGTTFRTRLSSNRLSVVSAVPLPASLNVLDVVASPGGAILGVDYTGNQLVVARPSDVSATSLKVYDIFPWRAPATGVVSFVIGGHGFAELTNTTVTIGGLTALVQSVSSTRIRGLLPTNAAPTPALLDVVVHSGPETVALSNAFRYLPDSPAAKGQWTEGTALPQALGEVAAGAILGLVYVVGDGHPGTFAYNPQTASWISGLAARPLAGDHHASEVVSNKWYVFGGMYAGENKVRIYDPETGTWSFGADIPWPCGSGSSAQMGGKVYLAGGIANGATVTSNAVYDPVANTWTPLAPMPAGRNHAASGTDGHKFYVFGGRGPGSGDGNTVAIGFDDVQIYDPVSNAWNTSFDPGSTIPALPQRRGGMGKAVFFEGEFYIMGGETTEEGVGQVVGNVYNRVDVYNPVTQTWRLEAPMQTPRHGHYPVVLDRAIYVPGGGESSGYGLSDVMDVFRR